MSSPGKPSNFASMARMLILLAAGLSMLLSVAIWFLLDDKLAAIFVGVWVPSILSLGAIILPRGKA